VVAHGAGARRGIHAGLHGVAHRDLAGDDLAVVAEDVRLDLLGVVHPEERQAGGPLRDLAAVADLAARLGVERRLVEHDDAPLAHTEALDRRALPIQGGDPRRRGELLVAPEARGLALVFDRRAGAESPGRARLLALVRHRGLVTGLGHSDAGLPADIG